MEKEKVREREKKRKVNSKVLVLELQVYLLCPIYLFFLPLSYRNSKFLEVSKCPEKLLDFKHAFKYSVTKTCCLYNLSIV